MGFLSAVGDRFVLWGSPGTPGISWGAWGPFLAYVAKLNWLAPSVIVPLLAWVATVAEVGLALALLVRWRLRRCALASSVLLLLFALTMTFTVGVKKPLDYSVFLASAGALLLAATTPDPKRRGT